MIRPISALTALGTAAALYGVAEAHAFTIRRVDVPCLSPGSRCLRVLHVSDLHMTPDRRHERRWVSCLAELEPDFVAATGDLLGGPNAVPAVIGALGQLLDLPGAFVLGSNDYYSSRPKNPLLYFLGPSNAIRHRWSDMPWRDLSARLSERGWHDLSNARATATVNGVLIEMRGVDDPHSGRDAYELVQGPFAPEAGLRLGVAHAPYRRILDPMAADATGLILAGHTHGGQVRIPLLGAPVTNCDLPRGMVRGLHRYDGSWLHVSAGVGTSPFAPFRFACRPEATLLTLTPTRDAQAPERQTPGAARAGTQMPSLVP